MSFIAPEPPLVVTVPPSDPAGEDQVDAGDFWPAVDLARMRATVRLDGTVTSERLRHAVVEAMAFVIDQLSTWEAARRAEGYATLAAVPARQIDGKSINEQRYLRAVYSLAKADLIERYRDYDTTAQGDKDADQLVDQIAEQRRNMAWAIQDIKGARRTTVDLI